MESPPTEDDCQEPVLDIKIRQVADQDQLDIVKLFQAFDNDKYKYIKLAELKNNNNRRVSGKIDWESRLPRLRIDKKGGLYLDPMLDSNKAYFHCYVAQDMSSRQLIGYVLFFNTLDEHTGHLGGAPDDPIAVIEDLYVKPSYRGRGIGTQLFRRVLKASLDRGCFSCECLLIPESKEGLQFWKRKVGENRILDLLSEQKDSAKNELIVLLNRSEMENYLSKLTTP